MSDLSRLRSMLLDVGAQQITESVKVTLQSRVTGQGAGPVLGARTVSTESTYAQAGVAALEAFQRTGRVDSENRFVLEAIVMPLYRPVVDVVDDYIVVDQLQETWKDLGDESRRDWTTERIRGVGRVNVPGIPYAGTAFVVGPNLLMTNRHVAAFFAQGLGRRVDFQAGQSASIGFYHEKGGNKAESLMVEEVVLIHPWWDMAILKVAGLIAKRTPLTLSTADPEELIDNKVVVIGYPGYDPTDDPEFQRVQERIFRGTYYVKRFQPGILRVREQVESYGRMVSTITHNCSTLGGNSGSAVIDVKSGEVLGLHFMGAYLQANYAVPTYDLAGDSKVVSTLASAGVQFSGRTDPSGDFWGQVKSAWEAVDLGEALVTTRQEAGRDVQSTNLLGNQPVNSNISIQSGTATFTVPLQITVSVGTPVPVAPKATVKTAATAEGQFSSSQPAATMAPFHLDALKSSTFSWKSALSLALASKLAYEVSNTDDLKTTVQALWHFDKCAFITVDATQCFWAVSGDIVVVSFRGTESSGDWLHNLNVPSRTRQQGIKLHRGFLGAFQTVEDELKRALSGLTQTKLLLTGHSLGGALATVMAVEWQATHAAAAICTFGQPAVGAGAVRSFFLQNYSGKFFRIVNDDDIVARVPPGYEHVGRLLHFNAQGNLQSGRDLPPTPESMVAATEAPPMAEVYEPGPPMLTQAEYRQLQADMTVGRAPGIESLAVPIQEGLVSQFRNHSLDRYIPIIAAKAR